MSSVSPLAYGTTPISVETQEKLGGKASELLNEYLYRLLRAPQVVGFHLTPLEVDLLMDLNRKYLDFAGPGAELKLEISLLDLIRIYSHKNP